ncbi:hypothetical protein FN846DRAFT_757136, partial [Sphaerosporella brunnea]
EAKKPSALSEAIPQLIAYLAALQHARKNKFRIVTSVYGIATDAANWVFVRLDQQGCLKTSK